MDLAQSVYGAIQMLLYAVFSLVPIIMLCFAMKWLYESKKSLAEISADMKEIKEQLTVGDPSRKSDHG